MAGDDAGVFTVELRRIQWVRYRTDKLAERVRRGVRVTVEGDDIFCTCKSFDIACRDRELGLFAAEHCGQREHGAPFALKAAEAMAARILRPRSGEKVKPAAVALV